MSEAPQTTSQPSTSQPIPQNTIYCRNCGKQVSAAAIACPGCGAEPRNHKHFCHNCGKATTDVQIVCTQCGVSLVVSKQKTKTAAGLLAIFLGHLGAHKFYLGYTTQGAFMLCASLVGGLLTYGAAMALLWIIAVIEGIIYLTKSDQEFTQTYVTGKKTWF